MYMNLSTFEVVHSSETDPSSFTTETEEVLNFESRQFQEESILMKRNLTECCFNGHKFPTPGNIIHLYGKFYW